MYKAGSIPIEMFHESNKYLEINRSDIEEHFYFFICNIVVLWLYVRDINIKVPFYINYAEYNKLNEIDYWVLDSDWELGPRLKIYNK